MKTYIETPQGVITESNLTSGVNHRRARNLRILYICLGVSVALLVLGIVLLLMR
jgi:hypothetical protein